MPKRKFETEKDVKNAVKALLNKYGWFWFMPAANGFGSTGVADFCALKGGIFLTIETKFGTRKLRAMQAAFLASIMGEQGFAFVVTERTLDALELWLSKFSEAAGEVAGGKNVKDVDGASLLDAMHVLTQPVIAACQPAPEPPASAPA